MGDVAYGFFQPLARIFASTGRWKTACRAHSPGETGAALLDKMASVADGEAAGKSPMMLAIQGGPA